VVYSREFPNNAASEAASAGKPLQIPEQVAHQFKPKEVLTPEGVYNDMMRMYNDYNIDLTGTTPSKGVPYMYLVSRLQHNPTLQWALPLFNYNNVGHLNHPSTIYGVTRVLGFLQHTERPKTPEDYVELRDELDRLEESVKSVRQVAGWGRVPRRGRRGATGRGAGDDGIMTNEILDRAVQMMLDQRLARPTVVRALAQEFQLPPAIATQFAQEAFDATRHHTRNDVRKAAEGMISFHGGALPQRETLDASRIRKRGRAYEENLQQSGIGAPLWSNMQVNSRQRRW